MFSCFFIIFNRIIYSLLILSLSYPVMMMMMILSKQCHCALYIAVINCAAKYVSTVYCVLKSNSLLM